jgi:hypothetical protein
MARGSTQATGAATSAQNLSNQQNSNSNALYGVLAPELEAESAHPSGFTPTDLAAMGTAGQQSAGGSMAGAVGQGSLLASRTRNAGTADAAIGQSARSASQAASTAALKPQLANAELKNENQQRGLSGLENLYNTNVGSSIGALGQVAPNVNADTQAKNASYDWASDILSPILGAASNSKRF